jgi:hypothetical protein
MAAKCRRGTSLSTTRLAMCMLVVSSHVVVFVVFVVVVVSIIYITHCLIAFPSLPHDPLPSMLFLPHHQQYVVKPTVVLRVITQLFLLSKANQQKHSTINGVANTRTPERLCCCAKKW